MVLRYDLINTFDYHLNYHFMVFIVHGFLFLLRYWYCPAFPLGLRPFNVRCLTLHMIPWIFLPTFPFEQLINCKRIIANLRYIFK